MYHNQKPVTVSVIYTGAQSYPPQPPAPPGYVTGYPQAPPGAPMSGYPPPPPPPGQVCPPAPPGYAPNQPPPPPPGQMCPPAPPGYPPSQPPPPAYMQTQPVYPQAQCQPTSSVVVVNSQPSRVVHQPYKRDGTNHLLHLIITLFFWPWVIVWIIVCIMEEK